MRENEYKKNVKTLQENQYTTSRKKDPLMELHPYTIMDLVVKENHTIDWDGVTFPTRDTDWIGRGMKEAVNIRKTQAQAMNRDVGHHQLPMLYS